LDGFSLVLACTNSREVNAKIASVAKERGIWCNIADAPQDSDFHTASVIRRGEIAVGVSTGATSPILARFVRQKIEAALSGELETLLEIAGSYHIPTEMRGDFWRQLLQSEILSLLNHGQRDAAALLFEKLLADVSRGAQAS
jgi:siroheme synthase-like protein